MKPQPSPEEALSETTTRCLQAVAVALQPVSVFIDADPKGLDAVVMAAVLRGYADFIEFNFGEGNDMGPLKQAVDSVRQRITTEFMKGR